MLNTAILMGRLTRDPELRHTQTNIPVVSFTLAVDRDYRSRSNGNDGQPTVDFIDIVAWRNTAEFVCKWFRKGLQVAVQGHIQVRRYKDRDGNDRTAFEVVADEVHFADSKRSDDYQRSGNYAAPAADLPRAAAPAAPIANEFTELTGEDDGELPF